MRGVLGYATYGAADGVLGAAPAHTKRKYEPALLLPYLAGFEELKTASEKRTVALIQEHGYTHEMIADCHRSSKVVWAALAERMPVTATIRNLGKMSSIGLLDPLSSNAKRIADRISDPEQLKQGRVHPFALLTAMLTYKQGRGTKGSLTWPISSSILDALDAGYYAAFGNIVPSGARTLLAFDVSGSMSNGSVAGVDVLTPRVASGCMGMVTARVEKQWHAVAFTNNGWKTNGRSMHGSDYPACVSDLAISPRQRLDDVVKTMAALPMGGTDCALPMLYAIHRKIEVDTFVVYTDSETWHGDVHPHQALRQYRDKMGIAAKLAVVSMVANEFSIADPTDAGMLDLVGFDTAAPQVLADFSRIG